MERLDYDVVPLILEQAYHRVDSDLWSGDPVDNIDRYTLLSCALVNSSWRVLAQALLFRNVKTNPTFYKAFLQGELSESKNALLHHVRIVNVGSLTDASTEVIALLDRCALLHTLTLNWTNTKLMSGGMINKLRQIADSRPLSLQSLHIFPQTAYDLERPSSTKMYQLLAPLNTLKSLWLGRGLTVGAVPYQCRALHFHARLRDLRLEDDIISQTTLQWLLQSSQGSIQLLDFGFPLALDRHSWMANALRLYCSSIRILRFTTTFTEIAVAIVEMCTRLEELMMDIGHNDQPLVLPAVHPPFKHLLVLVKNFVPQYLVTAMAKAFIKFAKGHPSLCSLRLWGGCVRLLRNEQALWDLQIACATNKIELQLTECTTWAVSAPFSPCILYLEG